MRCVRRRAVAVRWWHLTGAWITCHTQANHIVVMHAGSSTLTPVARVDSWLSCTTKSSFCGDDLRLVRHSLSSWCTERRMEDWRKVRPNIVQSQWCYCSANGRHFVRLAVEDCRYEVFQLGFEYGNPQSGLHSGVELPTMWNSRVACPLIRWAVARKAPRFRHRQGSHGPHIRTIRQIPFIA